MSTPMVSLHAEEITEIEKDIRQIVEALRDRGSDIASVTLHRQAGRSDVKIRLYGEDRRAVITTALKSLKEQLEQERRKEASKLWEQLK